MNANDIQKALDTNNGQDLHDLIKILYPICRSITGNGVRSTLKILQQHVSLKIHEVKSGSKIFDWTVPLEWNVEDAHITSTSGHRVIDFKQNNLHILGYSMPVCGRYKREELNDHLFSIPDKPNVIPFRTSYYKDNWGFCLSHDQLLKLTDSEYDVYINSSFKHGSLTYGELFLPGKLKQEILISTHICHPSLCNDNLSGIVVSIWLAKILRNLDRKYSYRFVFVPATIGPITWLFKNRRKVKRIKNGLVITNVGDLGKVTYKKSRSPSYINEVMIHTLKHYSNEFNINEFFPYGYDERQYCSPGFDLHVGCFMRTANSEYLEYHTSADNLDFVKPASLQDSLMLLLRSLYIIENNDIPINVKPYCEPQLGKYGLYRSLSGEAPVNEMIFLWILNMADGKNTLLDIANKANIPFYDIYAAAQVLNECKLIKCR